MAKFSKVSTCLWFNDRAEEAANYYVSVFPNSKITHVSHYVAEGQEIHGRKPGSVMTVVFELDGMRFMALNGGPLYKFTEAVSFVVLCDTQAELDQYWSKLSADPKSKWPYQQIKPANRDDLGDVLSRVAAEFPESQAVRDGLKFVKPENLAGNVSRLCSKTVVP